MLRSHSFPHNVQRSQSNCVWFQWSCYWHSHLHSKQLSPVETSRRSLICCGGVSLCQFIKCVYAVCFPLLFARDGIRYRLMIVVVRSNASHMTWAVFVSFHPRVIWAGHVRVGGQRFFWKLPKTNLIMGVATVILPVSGTEIIFQEVVVSVIVCESMIVTCASSILIMGLDLWNGYIPPLRGSS